MENKNTNKIAIIFVAFLLIVAIGFSVAIYNTPSEVVGGTAGNFTINLTNGGNVLEDDGFLFYTLPGQKGLYRAEDTDIRNSKKLTENGDGFLQVIDNTYFFTDGDKIIGCDWDGNRQKVLVDYAKRPLVVGSLIFYLDKDGALQKYSMQNENSTVVIDKTKGVKEFLVYYKRIYYIDKSGNIRKTNFDNSDDKLFISAKAEKLSIDGQYIFYIENGYVYSAMLKDKELLKAKIVKADNYAVYGSLITYNSDNEVKYGNINNIIKDEKSAKTIYKGNGIGISIDEDYFYFFNSENKLMRFTHEGKDIVELN